MKNPFRANPNWRTAEHPGHRSKKEEERGGTRRAVAAAKVTDAVTTRITRQEKPSDALKGAGARIQQEKDDLAEARKLARQLGIRQPTRKVTGGTLRKLRKQAKEAKRLRR